MKYSIKKWRFIGLIVAYLFVCSGMTARTAAAEQKKISFDTFIQLEESCIELNQKISLESLLQQMPETISVCGGQEGGQSSPVAVPVRWEASPDYQTTDASYYLFQAKWDENRYQLDSDYNPEDYTPFIEVIIKAHKASAGQRSDGTVGSGREPGIYFSASEIDGAENQTMEKGIAHIVERARQQVEITWTPLKSMKGYISTSGELTGTYTAGTTYKGIPYGQLIDSGKYVPHDASFNTFLNAVNNPDSVFYEKRGSYDSKNSTYYGNDCSAFVSYAYGLPRMTTSMIGQSRLFTKVKGNSIENAQPGDCFNRAGRHVQMITDIVRDEDGIITAVEVCEQTPPKARKVVYTAERVQKIIDSGYTLLRFDNRQYVEEPEKYKGYHGSSSISHVPAAAVRENQKKATCQEEGSYEAVVYCSVCSAEISRKINRIPAGEHVFGSSTVTVQPGCVKEGEAEQSCKVCGKSEKVSIPAVGHSYGKEPVPATCKEKGYTLYRCTVCGESYKDDYTELREHSYEKKSVIPPNCIEKGYTVYSCKVCSHSYKDNYKDPNGHTYTYSDKKEETHKASCKICASSKVEKHSYTNGKCACGTSAVDLKTCDLLLSSKSFTYTGNSKKPDVTVKDTKKKKTLKEGQDYVISYTNNVKAGKAAAVVKGQNAYKGTVELSFTINKAQNSLTVSNITVAADPLKEQSAVLKIQTKSEKVVYKSDNAKIKVDSSGKLTVAKNYVGKGQITVTSGDSNYITVTKKVNVVVTPVANQITASDITRITSVNKKSFPLEARCNGGAAMKYSSSNPQIKVDQKGMVTVDRLFVGSSVITIQTAAKGIYKPAVRKITLTMIPALPRQIKGTSPKEGELKLEWRKISQAYGYQVAYSADKSFKSNVKTMKIGNGKGKEKKLAKTISGLKKKTNYYVCIRTMQVVKGKTYYSNWSAVQTVKVK